LVFAIVRIASKAVGASKHFLAHRQFWNQMAAPRT